MSHTQPDDGGVGGTDGRSTDPAVLLEELRRRNAAAVGMDLLFLFTVAFFAVLLPRGWEPTEVGPGVLELPFSWPAVITGLPLALLLYFGWRSSKPFFAAQLLTIAVTVYASHAGLLPL